MAEREYSPAYISKETLEGDDYVKMLANSALEETMKICSNIEAAGIDMTAVNKKGEEYPSSFKVEVEQVKDKEGKPIEENGQSVYKITATVKLGKNQDLTLSFKNDNPDVPSARLSAVTAANHVFNPKTFKTAHYNITAAKIQDNEYLNDTLKSIASIASAGLNKEEMQLRGEVSDLKGLGVKSAKFVEGGVSNNNKEYGPSIEVFAFNQENIAYKATLTNFTIPELNSQGKPNERAGEIVPVARIERIGRFAKDDNDKTVVDKSEGAGSVIIDSEATLLELEDVPAEINLAVAAHKRFDIQDYKEALAQETPAKDNKSKGDMVKD